VCFEGVCVAGRGLTSSRSSARQTLGMPAEYVCDPCVREHSACACGLVRWCPGCCWLRAQRQLLLSGKSQHIYADVVSLVLLALLTTASSGRVGWKATQRACRPRGRLETSTCAFRKQQGHAHAWNS
jgi:hypothetical protein